MLARRDGKVHGVNILDEFFPEAGAFYVMDRTLLQPKTLASDQSVLRHQPERRLPNSTDFQHHQS
jgi:hypothetical protein